jgi:hypothetical protein
MDSPITDVKTNDEVEIPELTRDDEFVLLRLRGDEADVTLFNISVEQAHDMLLKLVVLLGS